MLEVVKEVLPHVVSSMEELSGGGAALALTDLRNLHTKEKKIEHVDNLMVCLSLSPLSLSLSLSDVQNKQGRKGVKEGGGG